MAGGDGGSFCGVMVRVDDGEYWFEAFALLNSRGSGWMKCQRLQKSLDQLLI